MTFNQQKRTQIDTDLTRRDFIVGTGAAGLTFAFVVYGGFTETTSQAYAAVQGSAKGMSPNAWVTIGTDGSTTIMFPTSEMGQGVMTSLPLILAEFMDADWSKVTVVQSPPDHTIYGNPNKYTRGIIATLGSTAVSGYYPKLREVGDRG